MEANLSSTLTHRFFYGAEYKIDTSGNIFSWPQFDGWLEYKLQADSGDTWIVKEETPDSRAILAQLKTKGLVFIFGEFRNAMKFDYYELQPGDTVLSDSAYYLYSKTLAEGLGLVITEDGAREPEVLLGCIIDGVTYGEITNVKRGEQLPTIVILDQNYPNPFNSSTKISFTIPTSPFNPSPYQGEGQSLPDDGMAGERFTSLIVYDLLGREIITLISENLSPGNYEVDFDASGLSSGVYFYKLISGGFVKTKKMMLIK